MHSAIGQRKMGDGLALTIGKLLTTCNYVMMFLQTTAQTIHLNIQSMDVIDGFHRQTNFVTFFSFLFLMFGWKNVTQKTCEIKQLHDTVVIAKFLSSTLTLRRHSRTWNEMKLVQILTNISNVQFCFFLPFLWNSYRWQALSLSISLSLFFFPPNAWM